MNRFDVIKLLSDENRFNILMKLLEYDELFVCEIEDLLGMKQANTSKHLRRFKDLGVVETTREKNMIKYRVSEEFMFENTDLIRYLFNQ